MWYAHPCSLLSRTRGRPSDEDDLTAHGSRLAGRSQATMGNVSNVGLMARKAEEYGSHPTTYEVAAAGTMRVLGSDGGVLMEHQVEEGDIWRAAFTKDAPIRDWVGLGVRRARATGAKAIFWLDARRAHDAELIRKVEAYLPEHDTAGLDIEVLPPVEACRVSCERAVSILDSVHAD
jgi:isocitrate dehydrogenase